MRAPGLRIVVPLAATALAAGGCGATTTVVTGDPPAATTAPARDAPPQEAPTATTAGTRPQPTTAPAAETRPSTDDAPGEVEDTGGVLVERPGDFPDGGEAFILARLHPDVARRCTRADPDTLAAGAVAGLRCATEAAFGAAAFYDLFPARPAAEAAYGRYRRANGVPLDRGACLGPRAGDIPAEGPWRAGPALGAGRAMCVAAAGRAWLVSRHPARIIAYLSAPTAPAVAAAWPVAAPTARPR